jgi:hypothetical protein
MLRRKTVSSRSALTSSTAQARLPDAIRKEIVIDASGARVWGALRARRRLHERLVPAFATDARLDGDDESLWG